MELNIKQNYWDYAEKDILRIEQTSAASTDGTATCSGYFGKVVRTLGDIEEGAEEDLTITNTLVSAGDTVLASIIAAAAGVPGVVSALTTAETITVTVSNLAAAAAGNCTGYTLAFLLIKA